jgi:hypothetical protein
MNDAVMNVDENLLHGAWREISLRWACAESLVEATWSTYAQNLECWVTVVMQFIFQYVT